MTNSENMENMKENPPRRQGETPESPRPAATPLIIVFFDGYCGLCNASVDWLLRLDRKRVLRFSPLQGETARSLLSQTTIRALDTVTVWTGGRTYRRSSAFITIFANLGLPWPLVGAALWIIPSPLRNAVYDFIARHRNRWFGKREVCRVPSKDERARFLD